MGYMVFNLRNIKDYVVIVDNRQHTARLLGMGKQGELFLELTGQSTGESGMGKSGITYFLWEGKWYYFTCKIFCPTLRRMTVVRTSPMEIDSRKERRYDAVLQSARITEKGMMRGSIDVNILNISKTGVRIETRHPLKIGKTYSIEMKLVIKHFSEVVRADCLILNERQIDSMRQYGCQFTLISPGDRLLLDKFLDMVSKA